VLRGQCRSGKFLDPPGMAAACAAAKPQGARADPCCARFSVKLRRPRSYIRGLAGVTPGLGRRPA